MHTKVVVIVLILLMGMININVGESDSVENISIIMPGENFEQNLLYTPIGAIDPINYPPSQNNEYYILQCNGVRDGTEKDILQEMGITIFNEYNSLGFIVHIPQEILQSAVELNFVRAITDYKPIYKFNELNSNLFRVHFFKNNIKGYQSTNYTSIKLDSAINKISNLGIIDVSNLNFNYSNYLDIYTDNPILLSKIKEVKYISSLYPKVLDLNQVRIYSGVQAAHSSGIYGEGIAVVREGANVKPRETHQEFGSGFGNITQLVDVTGTVEEWHITHTTAIWTSIGDDLAYRGLSPLGRVSPKSWDTTDTEIGLYLNSVGGTFCSDSWSLGGAGNNGRYDSYSQSKDSTMWNENVLFISSAGNYGGTGTGIEGDDNTVASTGIAKNGITAGGMSDNDTMNKEDDNYCNQLEMFPVPPYSPGTGEGASTGFTDDDRHKPDLWAAANLGIISATDTGDSDYSNFGGTSAAAPIIGATANIVKDAYLSNDIAHIYDTTPNEIQTSTIKALMYSSTYQSELGVKATRKSMGYGHPDLSFIGDNKMTVLNDCDLKVRSGSSDTFLITSFAGYDLRISLVWDDTPGATGTGKTLNNDLDLEVTATNGTYWLGNRGLFNLASSPWGDEYSNDYSGGTKSNPSVSSPGNADHANNDESVFINNPTGEYTIKVKGYDTPSGNIPYSLVVWGGMSSYFGDIYLEPGLQAISLKTKPTSEDLTNVLASVEGKFDFIQTYENETWKHYNVDNDFNNTLLSLNETNGFFINITELATQLYINTLAGTTTIKLYPKWNLVSYPTDDIFDTIGQSLSGITYSKVQRHDFIEDITYNYTDADKFTQGKSYWIYCNTTQIQYWSV